MDLGYLLVAAFFVGLFSLWLTGWLYRGVGKPNNRWTWFFIIWVVGIALSFIPTE
jgi:hypothetical protein